MTGFSISGPLYLVISAAFCMVNNCIHWKTSVSLTRNLQPRHVVLIRELEAEPFRIVIDVLNLVKQ